MSASRIRLILLVSVCLTLASMLSPAYAQNHAKANKLQVGYVVVTPMPPSTSGLAVFETFGMPRLGGALQAGVLPADLATVASLFVTTSWRLSKNLGVAIANPQSTDASVTFYLRDSSGTLVAMTTVTVKAHYQSAQFVTQLFAGHLPAKGDFDGTLFVTSTVPVAMVGLRFRGENFSTIPVTVLSATAALPVISAGIGGTGSLLLPQFADGGGWATEIVLSNSGGPLTVRVDVFKQDGSPMTVTLNGVTASSFKGLVIPPHGGLLILAPRNSPHDDDDF
jgi:hypothetical protein